MKKTLEQIINEMEDTHQAYRLAAHELLLLGTVEAKKMYRYLEENGSLPLPNDPIEAYQAVKDGKWDAFDENTHPMSMARFKKKFERRERL